MIIYGYTLINTEGLFNGRETETYLFTDVKARDVAMYRKYARLFSNLVLSQGMDEDEFGSTMDTKDNFISNVDNDKCIGVIQMSDYHIQFEPFTYEL